MSQRRRIVLASAVLLAAIGGCYAALHPAWRYEGGKIDDNGVVSYPRFVATFAAVPLNKAGSYTFTFRRFPSDASVVLSTPSGPRPELLEKLETRIALQVTDQSGAVRCAAVGEPAGRGSAHAYVTSSASATGISLMPCIGVNLNHCDPCTLSVRISSVDPATPAIPVVPTLEGGGIELP